MPSLRPWMPAFAGKAANWWSECTRYVRFLARKRRTGASGSFRGGGSVFSYSFLRAFALATLWTLGLAGCNAAPSQTILGSYFPSWMICALVGLGAAVLFRQLLAVIGIDRTLPAPLLVYLAFAVAAAFATWLIWLDQPLRS
jgi:YtcA family